MDNNPFVIEKTIRGYTITWPPNKFQPIETEQGMLNLLKFLFEQCDQYVAKLMVRNLDDWEILYIDNISFYQVSSYQKLVYDSNLGRRQIIIGVVVDDEEEAIKIQEKLYKQLVWKILQD